jgi:hypothetical protein
VTEKEGLEGVEEAGGMADPSQQKVVAVMSTLQAQEDAVAVITAVFHNNRQNHPINSISKRGRVAVVEARGGPVRRH